MLVLPAMLALARHEMPAICSGLVSGAGVGAVGEYFLPATMLDYTDP